MRASRSDIERLIALLAQGHGYWYANEWIATDVTLSLRYPIPPEKRCLVNVPGTRVWRRPDEYPQYVADRLLAAFPELRRAGGR